MLTSPPAVGNFSETYASSMSLLIPAKDRLCRSRISDSRSRSLMSLSFGCCGASLAIDKKKREIDRCFESMGRSNGLGTQKSR